jgi:hypothetical protein
VPHHQHTAAVLERGNELSAGRLSDDGSGEQTRSNAGGGDLQTRRTPMILNHGACS